jgi:uridine kinase
LQYGVGCAGSESLKNSKLISYQDLLSNLKQIDNNSPHVFAIDGVAGSGKTSLASQLQLDTLSSQLVHMDDLYSGWKDPLSKELTKRVIDEILNPFLQGNEVIYRKFNWQQNVFGETVKISSTKTLFLEGVGAGQSAFRKMLSRIIWVEFDAESGFERVIARDGEVVRAQMLNFLVDQNKHFSAELTNKAADYTISGVP